MSAILNKIINNQNLIIETKELIKEVYLMDNTPWVIGYSGGKDSTTTTQIIIDTLLDMRNNNIELNKKVYVISSDTLVETPMIIGIIRNTIQKINELSEKFNLPIVAKIIKPAYDRGFWANLIGRGYPCPNQTFRWCTDRLKIEPANNFINNVVSEYGEAVMVLGVRNKESNSRDRVLESHTIEGKKLMRHTTMPNAYVFAPIRKFSVDDVWNYLLENPSPWGGDNNELFKVYRDSSEDCPLIIDEQTKAEHGSCGNSRFGCWVCTVVKKDKSLTGFIKNGVNWLMPLLEYRNWLYSIRDVDELRMKRRSNGSLYYVKLKKASEDSFIISAKGDREKNVISKVNDEWIDVNGLKWKVFEGANSEFEVKNYIIENNIDLSSGENPRIVIKKIDDNFYQLGNGPFTMNTRKLILKKLFLLQKEIGDKYKLIQDEELNEIIKLWRKDGDWNNTVNDLYFEVFGRNLKTISNDVDLFEILDMDAIEKICEDNDFNSLVYSQLIQVSQRYAGYINRKETIKDIQKILSKEFVYLENGGQNDNK